MKKIPIMFVVITTVVSSGLLAADGLPPGKWWKRHEIAKQLSITPQQQDQLEEVFRKHANELIDLRAESEKRALALRGELDRPQLDRQAIQAAAGRLSGARAKLFERELMMLVDMREVLSADQWNRFRTMLERREQAGQRQPRPPAQRRPGRPQ